MSQPFHTHVTEMQSHDNSAQTLSTGQYILLIDHAL